MSTGLGFVLALAAALITVTAGIAGACGGLVRLGMWLQKSRDRDARIEAELRRRDGPADGASAAQ